MARSGKIGEIRDVEACFTRLADLTSRERTDASYGGAFLEFGGYALLPIFKLLGMDYREVRIDSILGEGGIDLYTKVQLLYEKGMATAKTGVGVKSEGQLVIAGTKGYILAPSPWWLTKKFEVRYENSSVVENYEPSFQGDGLRYEINEFISKINGNSRNGYKLTDQEAVAMAEITEKFMKKRQEMQKVSKAENKIRLGIIGTGRIAHRFAKMANETELIPISYVYNPHLQSAEQFAEDCGISFYTDNWDTFVSRIDAAYIASPHQTHESYAKNCLRQVSMYFAKTYVF